MRYILWFFFCLANIVFIPFSQAQFAYIITGKSFTKGWIEDQGIYKNNREVRFKENDYEPYKTFYPSQIKGYSTEDRKEYITKSIQENDSAVEYFLLKLAGGEVTLYMLKAQNGDRFFGDNGNGLVELKDSQDFNTTLPLLFNTCREFNTSFLIARHNSKALTRAFKLQKKCYKGHFPSTRMGAYFGLSATRLSFMNINDERVQLSDSSPFFGAFVDTPIGVSVNWFIVLQAFYQKNSYSLFRVEENINTDYIVHTSTLSIPVSIKYSTTEKTFRKFASSGLVYTHYLNYENYELTANRTGSVIELDESQLKSSARFQLGAIFGAGIEYSFTPRKSIGAELRYTYQTGISDENNPRQSSFQILTTLYF
jgi:hypothetical protein